MGLASPMPAVGGDERKDERNEAGHGSKGNGEFVHEVRRLGRNVSQVASDT